MQKSALLILNGDPPSKTALRALAAQVDLVVAADGGANSARRFKIRPDLIVGDLDSITPATRRHFRSVETIFDPSQETTDFEKALAVLRTRKFRDIVVVGAAGGRLDFTLGNFVSIFKFTASLNLTFRGDDWFAVPVSRRLRLFLPEGTTVSLLPFGSCSGISLTGFRYPLRNASMRGGATGLSNVAVKRPCEIRVRSGNLLVVVS